jgi:hypothetical protein
MHLKFVTVINMMTASQIHYLNLNYLLSTQWWGCIQKSKSWSNSCSALYRICLRRTCPNSSNKGNVAICFCIVGAWRQHLENKMFSILWKMHFFSLYWILNDFCIELMFIAKHPFGRWLHLWLMNQKYKSNNYNIGNCYKLFPNAI